MKIDKSNMRQVILDFPGQFRIGLESAKNIKVPGSGFRVSGLVICGMGGSAIPGDILKMRLDADQISLPLYIHRNYGLPRFVKSQKSAVSSLVICISYSGNTEETLSAFRGALRKKIKIAAICSGGELARLCQKNKIPAAVVPSGYLPRMALGFQFAALIKILENSGLIKNGLGDVFDLENMLKPERRENEGKELAKKLKGKIPLIYASEKWESLARIWKFKFNENTKIPAFFNYFPELNHQEHNQFEGNKNNQLAVIMLKDPSDHPRIKKRMEMLAEILKSMGVPAQFIDISGKNVLYKVFNNILLSDWASYYLALEYKTDPTPVKLNDEFKKRLRLIKSARRSDGRLN